jgi:NADH-quinone oxidoreductase subunit F
VFAGGDVITGPNSVVNAIAAGKRAATMIDRHVRGTELKQPAPLVHPREYVEPLMMTAEELETIRRADPPMVPMEKRRSSFVEVELTMSEPDAQREARRCMRCDLDFTREHREHEHARANA